MSDTKKSHAHLPVDKIVSAMNFSMLPLKQVCCNAAFSEPYTAMRNRNGIMLPLIVVKAKKKNEYVLIDGYKRFCRLKKLRRKNAACGIIHAPLNPGEQLLLRVKLNADRKFTLYEKIALLKKLAQNSADKMLIQ